MTKIIFYKAATGNIFDKLVSDVDGANMDWLCRAPDSGFAATVAMKYAAYATIITYALWVFYPAVMNLAQWFDAGTHN